jgi:hypothetical protein
MQLAPLTFKSIMARGVVLKLKRPVVARIATIPDWPLILIDLCHSQTWAAETPEKMARLPKSGKKARGAAGLPVLTLQCRSNHSPDAL